MPSSSSSAAPDVLLQLRHVSKIYGELHAVDDVSLDVPRGQWLSLVGSSGSGKTTLMNIIGCMDTATRGSVLLDGRELGRLNAAQLTEIRKNVIGLVFQQFHLIPHLTAVENVMVAQYYHSMTDEKEALEALGDVGLGERAHHLPSQLSGGEQQRVCIARALINHPEIVLADEPTGNLDEANEQLVLDIFARLHKAGTTLIVVTHDAHVASCGQRQILLNHGRLVGEKLNDGTEGRRSADMLDFGQKEEDASRSAAGRGARPAPGAGAPPPPRRRGREPRRWAVRRRRARGRAAPWRWAASSSRRPARPAS